jgi:hypothetical protein
VKILVRDLCRICLCACVFVGVNWNDVMQCVYVEYVDKGKWKVCLTGGECGKK